MRRQVRRRRTNDNIIDCDRVPSLPIVQSEATPESDYDYWLCLSARQKSTSVSTGKDDVVSFDQYNSNNYNDDNDDGSTTNVV